MPSQAKWGLFQGFNPHPPEAKWTPPYCQRCGGVAFLRKKLLPWVDWWSIGAIGYCAGCSRFYHVASKWEQLPGTHLKEERQRLVGHEIVDVEFEKLPFEETKRMWVWHEELPHQRAALEEMNDLRKRHKSSSEEGVLLSHMLWSLIWNVNAPTEHLLEEFFEFLLAHPQYITYKDKTVWLGHQLNLAEALERRYPQHVARALFNQWQKHRPSHKELRNGLGFFIPTDSAGLSQYGAEFVKDAELARERMVI